MSFTFRLLCVLMTVGLGWGLPACGEEERARADDRRDRDRIDAAAPTVAAKLVL